MTTVHLVPYVRNGNMVITSGQLAFNEAGRIDGDIAEQTARILNRIGALLSESGMNLDDVGKTSVWLVNADDFSAFNEAYAAVFGDHKPARSTVVSQLTAPGALIEIEALAWKRN